MADNFAVELFLLRDISWLLRHFATWILPSGHLGLASMTRRTCVFHHVGLASSTHGICLFKKWDLPLCHVALASSPCVLASLSSGTCLVVTWDLPLCHVGLASLPRETCHFSTWDLALRHLGLTSSLYGICFRVKEASPM